MDLLAHANTHLFTKYLTILYDAMCFLRMNDQQNGECKNSYDAAYRWFGLFYNVDITHCIVLANEGDSMRWTYLNTVNGI